MNSVVSGLGQLGQWAYGLFSSSPDEVRLKPGDSLREIVKGHYRKVKFEYGVELPEAEVIDFIKESPQLELLNLGTVSLTDEVLLALQKYCPGLKCLSHCQLKPVDCQDSLIDFNFLEEEMRKIVEAGEDLTSTSRTHDGWKEAVRLIGQEEKLFTERGIQALASMQLLHLSVYYHPRLGRQALSPLMGSLEEITIGSREGKRIFQDDPTFDFCTGTLITSGREIPPSKYRR